MDSLAHKMDRGRVRHPRVHITYDVETNGAMVATELPFVVGILADLSGKPKEALRPLADRTFTKIDRDNLNDVMEKAGTRLTLRVQDRLSGADQKIGVELNFKDIRDFEPARVASQIDSTRELLEMRQKLDQMLVKMEGKPQLEKLLAGILADTERAKDLARQMGIEQAAPAQEPQS